MNKNLKKHFDLFIFDLDGTLVDSKKDLSLAVNHALSSLGMTSKSQEQIDELLSIGSQGMLMELSKDAQRFDEVFKLFSKHYEQHILDHTQFYPGVLSILQNLQDKIRAIMSNKRERFCKMIIQGLNANEHFNEIVGGDRIEKKPSPKALIHLLNQFQIKPQRAIMIGDSPVDIIAGREAGMHTVGILQGFSSQNLMKQSQADILVNTLEDINELL